jgi:hypothetical protein
MISEEIRNLALQVAQALDNPSTWCRTYVAQDAAGRPVVYDDPTAVRWCALGHAQRLGGVDAAHALCHLYNIMDCRHHFMNDNDVYGREFVRDRLLELANS